MCSDGGDGMGAGVMCSDMTCPATWLAGNKKWLDLVWTVLNNTDLLIGDIVERGHSLLVEVYPAVFLSLIQLCLESRYRTNYGLIQALLRKEWLHTGYKFTQQAHHFCAEFLLFLHCVRQLTLWWVHALSYILQILLYSQVL